MPLNRENVIRAAEKYVAKGKLEAAIKEYRKVLAENPNDANTLNRVGDLYARIERFDEAVRLFSQIAEQYTRDGFFVKAIAIYKKIIKLDPTSLAVYERLAELYHKQGLLNEARTQYQVLADYYEKHDNAASAITIYQRMAEFEPDNPSFHLKLAELYGSQRLTDKAIKEYRLLADLLIVGGSVDEAIQVYLKALEVSSSDLEFIRDAVSGLHDTGHTNGAAQVLARAVELNPEAAQVAQQVGLEDKDEPEQEIVVPDSPTHEGTSSFEVPDPTSSFESPDVSGTFDVGDAFDAGDTYNAGETFEAGETFDAGEAFDAGDTFDAGATFATDEAFEIPESSFDDIEEALEESGISAAEPAQLDDDGFTFDLDDDEPPASLVTPPADMLESDPSSSGTIAAAAPIEDAGTEDFDIELDFDITPAGRAAAAPAAAAAAEEEFEIDWQPDPADEFELPASQGAADPQDFDLDDTLPSQRVEPPAEPLELESFELDEPSLEPVEHVPSHQQAPASAEFDIQLDALDFDTSSLETPDLATPGLATPDLGTPDLATPDVTSPDLAEPEVASSPAAQPTSVWAEPEGDPPPGETVDVQAQFDQRREEDLLAEAKVFFKYGLQEKARDRLGELFQVRPDHLEGLDLQARIELDAGNLSDVMTSANLVSRLAGEAGDSQPQAQEIWQALRDDLVKAEFTVDGDRVIGEPGQKVAPDDRIAQLLDDLSLDAYDTPVVAPKSDEIPIPSRAAQAVEAPVDEEDTVSVTPEPAASPAVEAPSAEPVAESPVVESPIVEAVDESPVDEPVDETPTVEPVAEIPTVESSVVESPVDESPVVEDSAVEPLAASDNGDRKLISLVEELGLEDLEEQLDDELAAAPEVSSEPVPAAIEVQPADPLEDTSMSWLDDLESEHQVSASDEEKIFEEEDDFFDLAAELERELSEDGSAGGNGAEQPQEQSLEDIIEGFKQGVAENLSPEDYDTHFNLGIAYREMGLLDEAIGEFQLAAKDERYIVDSSSLLGICFLEKGLPELAVRSYRKGLESPSISEEATLGLLYDMGTAYLTLGDSAAAYKTFVEVYGMNSHYRDVSTRLQELKAQA